TQTDVSQILALVNRVLVPDIEGDRFITILLAKLDPRTRTLVYASAGHQTGYILDAAGAIKRLLPSTSVPLRIEPDMTFPAGGAEIPGEVGVLVLLMTDGGVEARSPSGLAFGPSRPLDVARVYRHLSAREIVANLYHAVRAFSLNQPQFDDITATVLKVNGQG